MSKKKRNKIIKDLNNSPNFRTKEDIVCDIDKENITMEFESFFSGKILLTSRLKDKVTNGTEIFKLEGI